MRPNIRPLTSVRFFAALLVVFFHYSNKHLVLPEVLTSFGYEAVTFFFVLSGFILTYTHGLARGINISAREFALSRFARIAPAYFLALLISAPFILKTVDWRVSLVPLMLQSWWPSAALLWNSPAWSLSNEVFFYALYPAVWRIWWCRLTQFTSLSLAVALVLTTSLLRMLFPDDSSNWHDFSAYFPLLNLPQFVLGAALGKLFLQRGPSRQSDIIFCTSIGLLGFIISYKSEIQWLGDNILLCLVFGAIIYGLAGLGPLLRSILSAPPLVSLGDASYAIYILHAPIWLWWDRIFRVLLNLNIKPEFDFAAYLTFLFAACVVVNRLFEKKVSRQIKRVGVAITAR